MSIQPKGKRLEECDSAGRKSQIGGEARFTFAPCAWAGHAGRRGAVTPTDWAHTLTGCGLHLQQVQGPELRVHLWPLI